MRSKTKLLTKKKIESLLKKLPDWSANTTYTKLSATFSFDTHVGALAFIARVTVHAEVLQHHPDIQFTYKKVKISITTHDAGGLTTKDFDLIHRIDKLTKGG